MYESVVEGTWRSVRVREQVTVELRTDEWLRLVEQVGISKRLIVVVPNIVAIRPVIVNSFWQLHHVFVGKRHLVRALNSPFRAGRIFDCVHCNGCLNSRLGNAEPGFENSWR